MLRAFVPPGRRGDSNMSSERRWSSYIRMAGSLGSAGQSPGGVGQWPRRSLYARLAEAFGVQVVPHTWSSRFGVRCEYAPGGQPAWLPVPGVSARHAELPGRSLPGTNPLATYALFGRLCSASGWAGSRDRAGSRQGRALYSRTLGMSPVSK